MANWKKDSVSLEYFLEYITQHFLKNQFTAKYCQVLFNRCEVIEKTFEDFGVYKKINASNNQHTDDLLHMQKFYQSLDLYKRLAKNQLISHEDYNTAYSQFNTDMENVIDTNLIIKKHISFVEKYFFSVDESTRRTENYLFNSKILVYGKLINHISENKHFDLEKITHYCHQVRTLNVYTSYQKKIKAFTMIKNAYNCLFNPNIENTDFFQKDFYIALDLLSQSTDYQLEATDKNLARSLIGIILFSPGTQIKTKPHSVLVASAAWQFLLDEMDEIDSNNENSNLDDFSNHKMANHSQTNIDNVVNEIFNVLTTKQLLTHNIISKNTFESIYSIIDAYNTNHVFDTFIMSLKKAENKHSDYMNAMCAKYPLHQGLLNTGAFNTLVEKLELNELKEYHIQLQKEIFICNQKNDIERRIQLTHLNSLINLKQIFLDKENQKDHVNNLMKNMNLSKHFPAIFKHIYLHQAIQATKINTHELYPPLLRVQENIQKIMENEYIQKHSRNTPLTVSAIQKMVFNHTYKSIYLNLRDGIKHLCKILLIEEISHLYEDTSTLEKREMFRKNVSSLFLTLFQKLNERGLYVESIFIADAFLKMISELGYVLIKESLNGILINEYQESIYKLISDSEISDEYKINLQEKYIGLSKHKDFPTNLSIRIAAIYQNLILDVIKNKRKDLEQQKSQQFAQDDIQMIEAPSVQEINDDEIFETEEASEEQSFIARNDLMLAQCEERKAVLDVDNAKREEVELKFKLGQAIMHKAKLKIAAGFAKSKEENAAKNLLAAKKNASHSAQRMDKLRNKISIDENQKMQEIKNLKKIIENLSTDIQNVKKLNKKIAKKSNERIAENIIEQNRRTQQSKSDKEKSLREKEEKFAAEHARVLAKVELRLEQARQKKEQAQLVSERAKQQKMAEEKEKQLAVPIKEQAKKSDTQLDSPKINKTISIKKSHPKKPHIVTSPTTSLRNDPPIQLEIFDFLYMVNAGLKKLNLDLELHLQGSLVSKLGIYKYAEHLSKADKLCLVNEKQSLGDKFNVDDINLFVPFKENINIDSLHQFFTRNGFSFVNDKASHLSLSCTLYGMKLELTLYKTNNRECKFIPISMCSAVFIDDKEVSTNMQEDVIQLGQFLLKLNAEKGHKNYFKQACQLEHFACYPPRNEYKVYLYNIYKCLFMLENCKKDIYSLPIKNRANDPFITYSELLTGLPEFFYKQLKNNKVNAYVEIFEFVSRGLIFKNTAYMEPFINAFNVALIQHSYEGELHTKTMENLARTCANRLLKEYIINRENSGIDLHTLENIMEAFVKDAYLEHLAIRDKEQSLFLEKKQIYWANIQQYYFGLADNLYHHYQHTWQYPYRMSDQLTFASQQSFGAYINVCQQMWAANKNVIHYDYMQQLQSTLMKTQETQMVVETPEKARVFGNASNSNHASLSIFSASRIKDRHIMPTKQKPSTQKNNLFAPKSNKINDINEDNKSVKLLKFNHL